MSDSRGYRKAESFATESEVVKRAAYALQDGLDVKKKLDREKDYNSRFLFINDRMDRLCWSKSRATRFQCKSIPLLSFTIRKGAPRKFNKKYEKIESYPNTTFSLVLAQEVDGCSAIDIYTPDATECIESLIQVTTFLRGEGGGAGGGDSIGRMEDLKHLSFRSVMTLDGEGGEAGAPDLGGVGKRFSMKRLTTSKIAFPVPKAPKETWKLRSHTLRPLKHPLTDHLDDASRVLSLGCFQLIMQYMGDLPTKSSSSSSSSNNSNSNSMFPLLQRLVSAGEGGSSKLQGEIYYQIMKQTTDNPVLSSLEKGWELLVGCCLRFLPVERDVVECVKFHAEKSRYRPDAVGGLAWFVHQRVEGFMETGRFTPRAEPLSPQELRGLSHTSLPLSVFNCTLEEVLRKEAVIKDTRAPLPLPGVLLSQPVVPEILKDLVQSIEDQNGLMVEGIFRRAAPNDLVAELQKKVGGGGYLLEGGERIFQVEDVLALADLLKLWLRSLTEPLIPYELYDLAIDSGREGGGEAAGVQAVLENMPVANQATLNFLIRFLNRVASQVETNQMSLYNLSLVFAPNLMKKPPDTSSDPLALMRCSDYERRFVHALMETGGEHITTSNTGGGSSNVQESDEGCNGSSNSSANPA